MLVSTYAVAVADWNRLCKQGVKEACKQTRKHHLTLLQINGYQPLIFVKNAIAQLCRILKKFTGVLNN